jgi:murein DD-endopeptidase MepM/ murein hydrolase activator NlpD
MTYSLRIRWNRLLTIAIATCLVLLSWQNWQTSRVIALDVPEEIMLAQDVSAIWSKGSFPVENFQSYTSPFGYRISPVTGERQFHNGLDMAAPRGSYIRSWWAGKITDLSDDTAGGTLITIQSGAWTHSYCHMEGYVEETSNGTTYLVDRDGGIQLALGQNIPAGARIGRIGMTGRTTGPHLHWVLKNNGSYVDPALVLKEMFKRQTVSSAS